MGTGLLNSRALSNADLRRLGNHLIRHADELLATMGCLEAVVADKPQEANARDLHGISDRVIVAQTILRRHPVQAAALRPWTSSTPGALRRLLGDDGVATTERAYRAISDLLDGEGPASFIDDVAQLALGVDIEALESSQIQDSFIDGFISPTADDSDESGGPVVVLWEEIDPQDGEWWDAASSAAGSYWDDAEPWFALFAAVAILFTAVPVASQLFWLLAIVLVALWIVLALAAALIGLVEKVAEIATDLFDSDADNKVRDVIKAATCREIRSWSYPLSLAYVDELLDGPTLDEDENSLLKLLSCLSLEVRTRIIAARLDRIRADIDGAQFDSLLVFLFLTGEISPDEDEWDDNTSRRLINTAPQQVLGALELVHLKPIIQAMFDGDTGDEDESAIVRLMQSLSCERRRALTNEQGFSRSEFDDEVDGPEWDDLDRLLSECGI